MTIWHKIGLALLCGPLLVAAHSNAQESGSAGAAASPGRDLVAGKCFQCHTDSIFRDLRQDRRAWEGTIYRMVGRGGLWTQDEIKVMADYLGSDFGPNAKPAAAQNR
ncbi:MAG TPA: hypothetical protein VGQ93_12550 [Lysobacter sp.]|nr:hypothetical protein [Lysobacter sp.]